MFCDGCGTAVQPGQPFCSRCGKQIVGPVSIMQPRPGRVQEHVRLLGLFWLAFSAFNTVGSVVLYVLANTLFAHLNGLGAPEVIDCVLATAAQRGRNSFDGQSSLRIHCRMGLAAARTLGAHRGSGPCLHLVVHEHSIRNSTGHLHDVGVAARRVGARVRDACDIARGLRRDRVQQRYSCEWTALRCVLLPVASCFTLFALPFRIDDRPT